MTHDMVGLLTRLDAFNANWRAVDQLRPERLKQLRRVATIESIGSSTRIEGSQLSDHQVEELLGRLGVESFSTRDEQEVAGYSLVMDTVFENHNAIAVTENYIKQLHGMLLKYSEKDERHRGSYKKLSNSVEAFNADGQLLGVVFETAAPFDTPQQMESLVAWYRLAQEEKILHPLIQIGVFVVVFLAIHPFQDGNGRLSRILTTLLLMKAGYEYVPYSSMESVVEANKEGYYLALRRTQKTLKSEKPDWEPWLLFFLRTLSKQTQKLQAKIQNMGARQLDIPEWAELILKLVDERKRISVAQVVEASGAPRETVRTWLKALVKSGSLKLHGAGRGAWYTRV